MFSGSRVAEVAPAELDGRAQHLPVEYSGPGEAFVRHIANATYGGQVALTEPAWTTVQDHIPGQAQACLLLCVIPSEHAAQTLWNVLLSPWRCGMYVLMMATCMAPQHLQPAKRALTSLVCICRSSRWAFM